MPVESPSNHMEGLVLCRAGGERLAVPAAEVDAIELPTADALYAGTGFDAHARAPDGAKAMRTGPHQLSVDSVQVWGERATRLAVPPALRSAWGGALEAFVEVDGALWPVISLRRFTFVEAGR